MKKIASITIMFVLGLIAITTLLGCVALSPTDNSRQLAIAKSFEERQPVPIDIDYSLERYNLIRRTYWVNGQREKAIALPCPVSKPLGYVVLINHGAVFGRFVVDGKVTSLNAYLTPDSEYYEKNGGGSATYLNRWLADVDGAYGSNDSGIFFFTPDGKYIEWKGDYLYSDIPFEVQTPILRIGVN